MPIKRQPACCRRVTVGGIVIQAATVQVYASQIELNAPMVQCSGILQAAEVIANTVSASTYTPGAGNVW